MKMQKQLLTASFLLLMMLAASGQVAQIQYEVVYNPASSLYEAHAHVLGAPLTFPSTIPFPSKFTVVVPAAISNSPFTVVKSVNPPGLAWSQSNNIYEPAAAPASDFHAFTISGGGGNNAYQDFSVGSDILLFTFSVPDAGFEENVRCYINGSDPGSSEPGMAGLDFTQAFKTCQAGVPSGVDRYLANTDNRMPKPNANSGSFALDESLLHVSLNSNTP